MKITVFRLVLGAVLAAGMSVPAVAAIPNIDLNRAGTFFSNVKTYVSPMPEKDEIALGRELAGRTMGAAPLINDAALQQYVNRIGRSISSLSERSELPWRFGVIDTSSVNAFATPGGIILITRGLYEILDNEAQLAGVLGHEVAHVEKYHHVQVIRDQAGVAALKAAGEEAAGRAIRNPFAGAAANQFIGAGAQLWTISLDRGAELDADRIGVNLAARAGYSPAGLIDVLHKLNARTSETSTKLLTSTHPHPNDRLTALGPVIEKLPANLLEGEEPPLQVAGSSLPAPQQVTAGQPVPAGRALSSEPAAAQQQSSGTSTAQQQPSGGIPGIGDPGSLLRGLIRR